MLTTSVKHGVRAVFVEARVAVLLWLANVALVLVALPAVWSWWSRTSLLPEADPLLERFHVGIFRDLLIDGGSNGLLSMLLTALGLLIVSVPVSAFLAAGTLEVLISDDSQKFFQRFMNGAGHFFWRFLRLAIIGGIVMAIAVVAAVAGVSLVVAPLIQSNWAPGAFVALAIECLTLLVVTTFFLLSFDYARIRLALTDRGGALRAWLPSLWLVLRHPLRTYGLAFVFALLFAALCGAYLLTIARLGSHTMTLIVAGIAIQQVFLIVRAALRIGLLAGEIELYQWLRPAGRLAAGDRPPQSPLPLLYTAQ
jgi:hypothetical protein